MFFIAFVFRCLVLIDLLVVNVLTVCHHIRIVKNSNVMTNEKILRQGGFLIVNLFMNLIVYQKPLGASPITTSSIKL
jgi:hypothetical protein